MINAFDAVSALLKTIATKHGFFDQRFITDWGGIVGSEIAQKCLPIKMIFARQKREATLFLSSSDVAFKSMLLYYKEPILNRISLYFGVNFITDVKLAKDYA